MEKPMTRNEAIMKLAVVYRKALTMLDDKEADNEATELEALVDSTFKDAKTIKATALNFALGHKG